MRSVLNIKVQHSKLYEVLFVMIKLPKMTKVSQCTMVDDDLSLSLVSKAR